jgi:hypothetical protein
MRTLTAGRIAVTGTGRIPATAGGFRQATLDHEGGSAEEFAEQLLPTHTKMLVIHDDLGQGKTLFAHATGTEVRTIFSRSLIFAPESSYFLAQNGAL